MIVDVHAHYHPRAFQQALSRFPERAVGARGFAGGTHPVTDDAAHVATRLEMMDDADVEQILEHNAPRILGIGESAAASAGT